MNKKILVCKILEVKPSLYFGGSPDYKYAVYDGKKIVSQGISSSLGWEMESEIYDLPEVNLK